VCCIIVMISALADNLCSHLDELPFFNKLKLTIMKNLILLIIPVLFFLGCGEQKLSLEAIEDIKVEIRTLISEHAEAYETRNIEHFKNAVSDEIMSFGTNRETVATNTDEWAELFQKDFQTMDSTPYTLKFEEPENLSIQVSETGDMATAICDISYEVSFEGEIYPSLFRMAITWRKENGTWKIVHWLAVRPGE